MLTFGGTANRPTEFTARRTEVSSRIDDRVENVYVIGKPDDDPVICVHYLRIDAELITQIRLRRIPGALSMLIRMVGTREEEVQAALRKAMPEFTFQPFLVNFDHMDEELRPVTGHLVKQIDPEVKEKIIAEMKELSPVRRRRAVSAVGAMGLVHEVEDTIIGLLSDEDHMVRVATAKVLADSKSMPAWEALRDALLDRSVVVKEAAESSLERISQSLLKNLAAGRENDAAEQEDEDYTKQPEEVAR